MVFFISSIFFFLGLYMTIVLAGKIARPVRLYNDLTIESLIWALMWTVWWYVSI